VLSKVAGDRCEILADDDGAIARRSALESSRHGLQQPERLLSRLPMTTPRQQPFRLGERPADQPIKQLSCALRDRAGSPSPVRPLQEAIRMATPKRT
jgi:hypothetical protein